MAKTLAKVLVSGNVQLQMALDKILECLLDLQPKSRQDDTKHDDILQSLLYQQEDMEKKSCSLGFIKKVFAFPLYIFYWSKPGLTIYYIQSTTDATGLLLAVIAVETLMKNKCCY